MVFVRQVVRNTNKPEWNEVFNVVIEDALHDMLFLEVWNQKLLKKVRDSNSLFSVFCWIWFGFFIFRNIVDPKIGVHIILVYGNCVFLQFYFCYIVYLLLEEPAVPYRRLIAGRLLSAFGGKIGETVKMLQR